MAEFSLDEMRTAHEKLEARMANACAQSKRSRESVRLIWVSKFHPFSAVKNAIALGATDFGEMETQKENFVRACRSLLRENRPLTTDFLPLAKASI